MKIKLNLIPPSRRDEIKKAKYFRNIVKWEFQLAVLLVLVFAMLFSIRQILQINTSLVDAARTGGESTDSQKEIAQHDATIRDINARVIELDRIRIGQLYWENLFLKLNDYDVPGVKLDSIATQNYAVGLSGNADTRDNLIIFKEKLAKEGCFSNVSLPLSNLVARENVDFELSFVINKDCLKK